MKKSVSMQFLQLTNGELATFCGHIDLKLTGNSYFPTPTPTLEDFRLKAQAYEAANDAYERGNKISKIARDTAKELVLADLSQLANYVQFIANYDEAMLLTSGFPLTKDRSVTTVPNPPVILAITDGTKSGEVKIKVECQEKVNAFTVQYKLQGATSVPQYKFGETKKTFMLDGLLPGKYYVSR